MQELINKITEKAGISADQAHAALQTIKEFIKEKFPMMAGAVDNFFPASSSEPSKSGDASNTASGNMMDKISDFIPGSIGQKAEGRSKAEGNLEDLLGGGIK